MNEFLKTIAPTLASALLGPLGGVAVAAIGNVLGMSDATTDMSLDSCMNEIYRAGKKLT